MFYLKVSVAQEVPYFILINGLSGSYSNKFLLVCSFRQSDWKGG